MNDVHIDPDGTVSGSTFPSCCM